MRRVHVPQLTVGRLALDAGQSRHVCTVLRAHLDQSIEVFDPTGKIGRGTIIELQPVVVLHVLEIADATGGSGITIAAALPKGDRADWMIEKLSELGVDRFVPLRTARSVVHPQGQKFERWNRIAIEAAKQSRRDGVMRMDPLTPLADFLGALNGRLAVLLTTQRKVESIVDAIATALPTTLLIGPEGGWSDDESDDMVGRGLTPVSLGSTILRIETAAVLGAGLLQTLRSRKAE